MAIQNRRGNYSDFDPSKMVEGEIAVVKSGDPNTDDGTSVYVATGTGNVKRVILDQDLIQAVYETTEQVLEERIDTTLTEDGKVADAGAVGDALGGKVDKETGKGLSTNDFTTEEKQKLAGIEAEANKTLIDTTLEEEGQAADAKATGDALNDLKEDLENKADPDGTYHEMTVGTAQQLETDQYTEDSEPYHFRKSGGGRVRVGDREIDKIVGGTVAWNQLITPIAAGTKTLFGVTFVSDGSGVTTVSGTATANTLLDVAIYPTYIVGHKYFLWGCPSGGANDKYSLRYNSNGHGENGSGTILEATASSAALREIVVGSPYPRIFVSSGTAISGSIKFVPQIIDLTTAFADPTIADYIYSLEQSTAGAGVAFLRRYIDIDTYHPYAAGTLKSVEGLVSHDMVGFNQWDEEWEVGGYSNATGGVWNTTDRIRSKADDYIPILPDTTYYFKTPLSINVYWYDSDKNYIGTDNGYSPNTEHKTPSNARYMRFALYAGTTTYQNDICINLSDPAKNGTYEPYEKHSYPLDSTLTLRGVPKLVDGKLQYDGDTYAADGTVTRRYDLVASSDCTVATYDAPSGRWLLRLPSSANLAKAANSGADAIGMVVSNGKLTPSNKNTVTANTPYKIARTDNGSANAFIFTIDLSIVTTQTQAAEWIATNPFYLLYEVETPTTETVTTFTNPQWVDGSGTEQYVSTSLVPIGHYTQYPEDLKNKIEGLPWDFASLIAPTEASYKATQNYTTGSLFIVNNILYKATAAIANGGTIIPGTNCTATTLAAVIAAL